MSKRIEISIKDLINGGYSSSSWFEDGVSYWIWSKSLTSVRIEFHYSSENGRHRESGIYLIHAETKILTTADSFKDLQKLEKLFTSIKST